MLWVVLVSAAGARQILLTSDNAALRRGLERRVLEQTADLRRLARQNEVLITSVGDGVYGVDQDGRLTFVNPSGAAALGYSTRRAGGPAGSRGVPCVSATEPRSRGRAATSTRRSPTGVVASAEEDEYVRADGSTFPVEITASPLLDEREHPGCRGGLPRRDPASRGRPDEERVPLRGQPRAADPADLHQGFARTCWPADGWASSPSGPPSLVAVAVQNSERLTRLINDLLDIERMESGVGPDGA